MNILVTGGAGYVGTSLVRKLDENQAIDSITVLDNLSRGNNNFFLRYKDRLNKVNLVKADILDTRTLQKSLKNIDIVYHLAANVTTPFSDQDPHLFEQVNHWGTANVALAAEKSDVSRFIYLSSVSVYGSSKKAVDESTPPAPRTYYGISKLKGEEQVRRLNDKMDVYIIRSGNVYGYNPSVRFDAVINKFMFEANFNGKIEVHGSGEQTRSFVSIVQTANILAKLCSNTAPPDIYNVLSDNWSILDIRDTVKKIYPELEMTFVSQDMKRRQIKVDTNLKLDKYMKMQSVKLEDRLRAFKKRFSF